MPALSRFQTLPLLIVEVILDHLLDTRGINNKQRKLLGFSILHSCSPWRNLFIKNVHSDLEIRLSFKLRVDLLYSKWPWLVEFPCILEPLFVKKVFLSYVVHSWHLKEAHLNSLISRLPVNTKFESVQHLDISVVLKDFDGTLSNIDVWKKILCHLNKLAPNAKSISLSSDETDPDVKLVLNPIFIDFALSLSSGITDLKLDYFDYQVEEIPKSMAKLGSLTNFSFTCWGNIKVFNQVVQRSADTLKRLCAEYLYYGYVDEILFDGDEPVIYPLMESLKIIFYDKEEETDIWTDSNHFPVLKNLTLASSNLDLVQVFFNNPSTSFNSFERLKIRNDKAVLEFAADFYAFSSELLTALKTVSFRVDYNEFDESCRYDEIIDNGIAFTSMIMDTAKELRQISIGGELTESFFKRLLLIPNGFARLRSIRVSETELSFLNILKLLKTVPSLRTLEVSISSESPYIPNVKVRDLVKHIETKLTDVGKNLTRLYLTCGYYEYCRNRCRTTALLAVLCPNSLVGFINKCGIDELRKTILCISKSDEFSNYSDRLQSIVKKKSLIVFEPDEPF